MALISQIFDLITIFLIGLDSDYIINSTDTKHIILLSLIIINALYEFYFNLIMFNYKIGKVKIISICNIILLCGNIINYLIKDKFEIIWIIIIIQSIIYYGLRVISNSIISNKYSASYSKNINHV